MDTITEAELVKAIEEATGSDSEIEGRTLKEWAKLWGCTTSRADVLLTKAHEAGILECVRVKRWSRVNSLTTVPAYRIRP